MKIPIRAKEIDPKDLRFKRVCIVMAQIIDSKSGEVLLENADEEEVKRVFAELTRERGHGL